MTDFWHPFADMRAVSRRGEFVIERAQGVHVWDADGTRYLDATASLWYCNVGHGRPDIIQAVSEQMRLVETYSCFGDVVTPPVLELASKVAALAPVAGSKVFFASGGSDAIDTAGKLARRYWVERGREGKTILLSRQKAYHGVNAYGTSLGGIDANRAGNDPLMPDTERVEWDSVDALAEAIDRAGADRVAAFFCEPVIGAGGVWPPPPGYLEAARAVCRERDVLFVADEVITGFGRCGDWFASGRFGLEPDLLVFAKGVTSGYLPLGGVIAAPHVAEPFWSGDAGMWRHGYTYSGHATVAAAGLANLDIMERERLPARALELERELPAALAPLLDHPLVTDIRSGMGVLAAVQLAEPGLADPAVAAAREQGILVRALVGGALQISPPLVFEQEHLDELAGGLATALDACAAAAAR